MVKFEEKATYKKSLGCYLGLIQINLEERLQMKIPRAYSLIYLMYKSGKVAKLSLRNGWIQYYLEEKVTLKKPWGCFKARKLKNCRRKKISTGKKERKKERQHLTSSNILRDSQLKS